MSEFEVNLNGFKEIIIKEDDIIKSIQKAIDSLESVISSSILNSTGFEDIVGILKNISTNLKKEKETEVKLKNNIEKIVTLYGNTERKIISSSTRLCKENMSTNFTEKTSYKANTNQNNMKYNVLQEDIEELEKMYGLTEAEAILLEKTIQKLGENCPYEKNSPAYINYIYGTLSTLCISYDAKRWRATTGQPDLEQAKTRLCSVGLSEQDILDLQVIINLQHGDFSYESLKEHGIDVESSSFSDETFTKMQSRCTDSNNDFAHQIVQIAAFAKGDMMYEEGYLSLSRYMVDLFNSKDLQHSYTDYEISFKGDIDSGRYSEADFQSDIDAINIYNRMKDSEEGAVNVVNLRNSV